MSSNFKKQALTKRAAVPQVDVEGVKPVSPVAQPVVTPESPKQEPAPVTPSPANLQPEPESTPRPRLTLVDTSETPTNRGFSMYPSRHRQVAKDLAYIEDRKPWEIIDDALEEYVVKHYGKEYQRKNKNRN